MRAQRVAWNSLAAPGEESSLKKPSEHLNQCHSEGDPLWCPPEPVTTDATIVVDPNAASLDAVELVMVVEEDFAFKVPD